MKIIMTICSAEKDMDMAHMPAKQRYLNNRIKIVDQIGKKKSLPFYILSGKLGVIKADELIPWYDKQLKMDDIPTILPIIIKQLKKEDIKEIIFYGNKNGCKNSCKIRIF